MPSADLPCRLVSVAEPRVYSGRKVPVNGAVPLVMEVVRRVVEDGVDEAPGSGRPRPRTAGSASRPARPGPR